MAFAEEYERDRAKGLRRLEEIRAEAGYVPDDEFVSPEDLNRYIELLEAHVVGASMAMSMIGSTFRR